MASLFRFSALFSAFFSLELFAAEVALPAIIKEGSATDILTEDPVLPVKRRKNEGQAGSGNIGTQLQDDLPLNFSNYGTPGQTLQIRGLSTSAEHTDVTMLGISLNPVLGGGFDFSTLPQFLWSDYQFTLMPTASRINPQANGGSLDLKLWTDQALRAREFGARGTVFAASNEVFQTSAGMHDDGIAALAGLSSGKVIGPSGSLSAQFENDSPFTPKIHLLASELDAKTPGSVTFPTPLGHVKTTRVIPILGIDAQLANDTILKSSVIYDYSKVAYHNPPLSDFDNRSYQLGLENALWSNGWRIGVSARQARFNGDSVQAPVENFGNVQIAKTFGVGMVTLDPVAQAVGVKPYGVKPQGSFGARLDLSGELAVFTRVSYLHRFPSFQDRYFDDGYFFGNPDLRVECTRSAVFGLEMIQGSWRQITQAYGQWRADTALSTGTRMENVGDSRVLGVLADTAWEASSLFTLENNFAYASSYVEQTRRRYYYLPMYADTLGLRIHPARAPGKLAWFLSARFNGPVDTPESFGATSELLGGYAYFNAGVSAEVFSRGASSVKASFKIENLFDHKIQFVRNYPSEGRVISGSVSGTF